MAMGVGRQVNGAVVEEVRQLPSRWATNPATRAAISGTTAVVGAFDSAAAARRTRRASYSARVAISVER